MQAEDGDTDDENEVEEEETALESYETPLDKDDCPIDEYVIFKSVLESQWLFSFQDLKGIAFHAKPISKQRSIICHKGSHLLVKTGERTLPESQADRPVLDLSNPDGSEEWKIKLTLVITFIPKWFTLSDKHWSSNHLVVTRSGVESMTL